VKRKPRVLPFVKPKPPPKPSIFDTPGGLRLTATVTVERIPDEEPK
jgi:hypothetical protein